MGLHVLVVARWYPAFDNPGRGSFVADHVAALGAAGVRSTIASFESLPIRGEEADRLDRARAAGALIGPAIEAGVRGGWATTTPLGWGVPGTPVARLPVLTDVARRDALDVVAAHAEPLIAFGLALAEREPIDIVHAHTGLPDGIAAAALADRLGVPLVVTEHSSTIAAELAGEGARSRYAQLIAPRRRLAAVSASLAAEVAALIGADPGAVAVVPNAVPLERFPSGTPDGRDPDELLYVAARRSAKGIETLLRAFARLRATRPGTHLRLVGAAGAADDEARWGEVVAELDLGEAVRFDGALGRDEVAAAMRHAAVFIHPSPHETFGMVAAEALASGLPVACTPSGGVDGIVGTDGRFGEIASDGTPDALAAAVLRVLDRRTAFDPEAMRASVEERFSPAAVARRTFELYGEVLGGDGRPEALVSTESGAGESGAGEWGAGQPAAGQSGTRSSGARAALRREPAMLVAGFGRTLTVDRIAALPASVREGLVVVTRGKPEYLPVAPPVAHWLQVDVEGEYKRRLAALRRGGGRALAERVLGFLRAPRSYLLRRRLLADPEGSQSLILAEHLADAARVAMATVPGADPDTVLVVAVEADDVIAIDELARRSPRRSPGLVPAPGTMRWLADRASMAARTDAAVRPGGAAGAGGSERDRAR